MKTLTVTVEVDTPTPTADIEELNHMLRNKERITLASSTLLLYGRLITLEDPK